MLVQNKKPYNELSIEDKLNIVKLYYEKKELEFMELSDLLGVSERSISRVLKEARINTRRKNRYTLNDNFFENINSEDKAYILGLLYADGFIGDTHYNNIVLGLNDRELVEQVAHKIDFTGEIRKGRKGGFENSKESYILNFSSEKMAYDLRNLGLYPNKSLSLDYLPTIQHDLFRHFIRGYFDGDGSIILSKHTSYHKVGGVIKRYEYPAYTFMLLGTNKFLLNIIDIMKLNHYKITDTITDEIKCLRVCAKCELKELFNYLYGGSNMYLKRKYNKWLDVLSAFMM